MNQAEWESYISKTITKFKKDEPATRKEMRAFLSENGYTQNSRSFVKEYSGGSTRGTEVSVEKTVKRLNKKVRDNKAFIDRRNKEIDLNQYGVTRRHIDTYTRELRKRAKTIMDSGELARVKEDLKKMLKIQSQVKRASNRELPDMLKDAVSTMSDIRYSRALRSSLNSQVKAVARSERTYAQGDKFFSTIKTDEALIDVVLSPRHVVYDICDEVALAGPYTKSNLPALGLHTNCQCRYKHHSPKTTSSNNARKGAGSQKPSKIKPKLAKDVY